ncbi:MAG TPA: immunoglobulin domain-containing protein [Terriglobales bacterium]|nr:immunoglobulin domain-containing protein [Terriglobales bacterium]
MRCGSHVLLAFLAALSSILAGCSTSSGSQSASGAPSITIQPSDQTVAVGQSATFSVAATGSTPLSYQWRKGSTMIAGATSASYTTPATTAADSGSQYSVVVSNSLGSTTSRGATLTVNAASSSTDVLTYHNDNARTGQNLNESILTTSNVNATTFGKLSIYPADGRVDAQPLYVSNVAVPGKGTHNLLMVASEHDTVYAFDADTGTVIWQTSMLKTGETPSDPRGCNQVTPEIGVTSTPVIDRARGANGTIYVVAMSKDTSGNYLQRLHALDLALGTELVGGPVEIQASFPGTGEGTNGTDVIFDPKQYKERVALLELNGVVYLAWASHCDIQPYTGWIMGYSGSSLAQTTVLNLTPNGSEGAIWASGAGMAADTTGNILVLDGNGSFDTTLNPQGFPNNGDYGNAFLKLSTSGGLKVGDYFEMFNQQAENSSDSDLGSGGALALPDLTDGAGQTVHLAVGAGKDGNLYLVNRDSMGKFDPSANHIYQELAGIFPGVGGQPPGVYAAPAYFNDALYYGAVEHPIMAFKIANGMLPAVPTAQSSNAFPYPGATPSISANGSSNGIVWAVENSTAAVLHAYDAATLAELYNSNQASGGRDGFGAGNKFMTPTIANGKVFVGTPSGVAVFGLLP